MNYYNRHIGDYLRDAAHLSLLEHGVYTRLMDLYYTTEQALPSTEKCCRLVGARTEEERQAVQTVLSEFFTDVDGGWRQERCEREIAARKTKAERNREVGQKGGRPRKEETQTVSSAEPTENPDGFHAETQTVSSENPNVTLPNSQEPIARERGDARGARLPPGFPDDDALTWARGERPDLDADQTAERFRDHWSAQPGKDGRKADWMATWRNWVRRERAGTSPPGKGAALKAPDWLRTAV